MLTRKIKLCHINAHITCRLCEGYLIDATTVTECLHTCRSLLTHQLCFPVSLCDFICSHFFRAAAHLLVLFLFFFLFVSSVLVFVSSVSFVYLTRWVRLSLRDFLGPKGVSFRIYPWWEESWSQGDASVIPAALFVAAVWLAALPSVCVVCHTTSYEVHDLFVGPVAMHYRHHCLELDVSHHFYLCIARSHP